jgi:hypothetical protein
VWHGTSPRIVQAAPTAVHYSRSTAHTNPCFSFPSHATTLSVTQPVSRTTGKRTGRGLEGIDRGLTDVRVHRPHGLRKATKMMFRGDSNWTPPRHVPVKTQAWPVVRTPLCLTHSLGLSLLICALSSELAEREAISCDGLSVSSCNYSE